MANKNINGRIQLKHDTSANWALATTFIPLVGEMCLYTDLKKFKIGDGTTTIANLPFLDNVEGYLNEGVFYSDSEHTTVIPASTGVIYVELSENKLYRYSGSAYVVIGGTDILVSGILKGDGTGTISAAVAGTDYQAPLPTVTNDRYLHTNSSTGALEWSEVSLPADMTGATSSTAGTHGLVPAPAAGKQNAYLRGDGTWVDISSIPVISQTSGTIAAGSLTTTVAYSGTFVNAYVKDANGNEVIAEIQVNAANVVFTINEALSSALTCIVMATSASVADANEEEY